MVAWECGGQGHCSRSHLHCHFPICHCCLSSPQGPPKVHTDKPGDPGHRRTWSALAAHSFTPGPGKSLLTEGPGAQLWPQLPIGPWWGGMESGRTEFPMALVLVCYLPILAQVLGSCSGPSALPAPPLAPSIPACPPPTPSQMLPPSLQVYGVGLGQDPAP